MAKQTQCFPYITFLMLPLLSWWRDREVTESDFPGKVTAIIPTSRDLMSATHCDRLQTAERPLYYKAVGFFFSTNYSSLSLFPMLKSCVLQKWKARSGSESSWALVENTKDWQHRLRHPLVQGCCRLCLRSRARCYGAGGFYSSACYIKSLTSPSPR